MWAVAAVLVVVGAIIPFLGSSSTRAAPRAARRTNALAAVPTFGAGVREVWRLARRATRGQMDGIRRAWAPGCLSRAAGSPAEASTRPPWPPRIVTVMVAGCHLGGALTLPQVGPGHRHIRDAGPVLAVEVSPPTWIRRCLGRPRLRDHRPPRHPRAREPGAADPGDIVISDVTFAYPTDEDAPTLPPPSWTASASAFPPEKRTAIVGASGSVESTSLLTRTWDLRQARCYRWHERRRPPWTCAPRSPRLAAPTCLTTRCAPACSSRHPTPPTRTSGVCSGAVDLTDWLATEKDGLDTVVGSLWATLFRHRRQRLAWRVLRDYPLSILDRPPARSTRPPRRACAGGITRVAADSRLSKIAHRISVRDADRSSSWTPAASLRQARTPAARPKEARSPALEAREGRRSAGPDGRKRRGDGAGLVPASFCNSARDRMHLPGKLIGWTKAGAWGSTNAIPEVLGAAMRTIRVEVWFGTHPDRPTLPEQATRSPGIAADPSALGGGRLLYAFGSTLPYLAKIIAPAAPSPSRVHPTKEIARGYLREVLGVEHGSPFTRT